SPQQRQQPLSREATMASQEPEKIAQFAGKRTVYRFEEIQEMCARGEVLAILFRQVKVLRQDVIIPLSELIENGVVKAPPQTIQQVPEEVKPWIRTQLQM
ncbi:MAG TPA: hypothetical protein PKH31_09385, partial [Candidatus Sumerlaeota bacterium]|nr:hypothetical protein [Candidatus Sumerlaeota bacterium]